MLSFDSAAADVMQDVEDDVSCAAGVASECGDVECGD
jgi:hypothetical protein